MMSMLFGMGGAMAEPPSVNGSRHPESKSPRQASSVDPTKPNLRVFRQADVVSLVQRMPASQMPNEGNAQQRRLLESMANDDGLRALSEVPDGNPLAELYARFPHFKDVLKTVEKSLALAACGSEGKPVRIPPILVRGEPGTGKTYFAQELARVLALHFVERDMSVTSEAFVISGQDPGWKNSKPGVVFDAVVNGKTANPLILLNEVDKARVTDTHNSPMAALYALLEPTSARHFIDEFVPVGIDTSRVVWMLTANEGFIPDPIVDRLEVFDIRMPTREECRAIATSVWTSICTQHLPQGHGFCEELGEPLLDLVSTFNPRNMRKALTDAAGSAALEGRKYLTLEDIEAGHKRYAPKKKSSIGFTAGAQTP
jgi:ATP-dependent Lon protease